jgi:hypothetical protein
MLSPYQAERLSIQQPYPPIPHNSRRTERRRGSFGLVQPELALFVACHFALKLFVLSNQNASYYRSLHNFE